MDRRFMWLIAAVAIGAGALLWIAGHAHAATYTFGAWWTVPTSELRVADGDSLFHGGSEWRLDAVDAAEKAAKCPDATAQAAARQKAKEAVQRLKALIAAAPTARVRLKGRKDKYGRRLAQIRVAGVDVAKQLVSEGLAKPYNGAGPRPNWCR